LRVAASFRAAPIHARTTVVLDVRYPAVFPDAAIKAGAPI
jgi:hypothetical protein